MDLIIGGAYQGKHDKEKEQYKLPEEEIFTCTEKTEPDFSYKALDHLELFVLKCVREGRDAAAFFQKNEALWQDKVLIGEELFSGVVPLEKENRMWREACGALYVYLAKEASAVTRIFLGIPERLKG